jgi:hypothetical protein
MKALLTVLTAILEALAPILKEVIVEVVKDTVETSRPDPAVRKRLLRKLRDYNHNLKARRSSATKG